MSRPNWWFVACLFMLCLILSQLVGCAPAMASEIPIKTVLLEAESEGLAGMTAIGEVIRNRAKLGHKTFNEVCLAPWQFSAWNDGQEGSYAKRRLSGASAETWRKARQAWEASEHSNLTGGSRHYHTVDVLPYWAKGKPTVKLGRHIFYANVR